MSSRMDLMDLARHLRQESLFVNSEKQNLQSLNEKVLKAAENLYHLSWIARQQRQILDNLLLSHTDMNLAACYQRSNSVETSNFIDSYKQLGVNDCNYSEFLQQLRENPKIIAACLHYGEKIDINTMHSVVNIIMTAIYGNCILPEDEIHALELLKELMSLQLAISDNPRRLLRHGSCAFSKVYKIFSECLFSAKIFLTAALHEPIMHLLMADDLFLDIDPSKAAIRFHPQERLRHFGKEGTSEYAASLQRYRNWTISKLVNVTNRFIEEIRNNLYCFPQSLSWLARQMYNIVMKAKRVEVREVGAMCADLVFAFFICPAIVDPESYGITDIPISYIARFNLMQVAQILQVLAMSKWEEIDPKLMDLYGKFEKDCMSSLLDLILEGSTSDSPADLVNQFQDLNRSAVLITESELLSLVSFLRSVETETSDPILKKTLYAMINHLPSPPANVPQSLQNGNGTNYSSGTNSTDNHPLTPSTKRSFLGKVSRKNSKMPISMMLSQDNHTEDANGLAEIDASFAAKAPLEDVLVVPIMSIDFDCPGMLHEDKVLAIESQKKKQSLENGSLLEESDNMSVGPETIEKRTRFSLSQDQESVGTSDNLEAISEAASNHSVASSLDLENENENDNLSELVSANVSGRGTPNVSGRDTPSSQIEGEEREQRPLDLMSSSRKQNQEDIGDKFGKFEIQPMMGGDETKSMVSDTWSTDVLASDSETVEQSDISSQVTLDSQGLLDASETASQSDAWSTDVLASDTERLQDLDTDDTASVARSDDTARSEADGEMGAGADDARSERKDVLDFDGMRDAFGVANNSQGFMPPHADNYSNDLASLQANFRHYPPMNEDASNFPERGVKLRNKSLYDSNIDGLKASDLLSMDIENECNVPTLMPGDNQSIHDESLSSMQSLGRVSLAVRELPDASDQDSGVTLLDSLQETVSSQNSQQSHRSSIVDILSLDLTRTLNLPAATACSSGEFLQANSSNQMDLDKGMSANRVVPESSPNSFDSGKLNMSSRNFSGERGAKRKLQDFGPEEVCPQFRAVSLSNAGNNPSDLHSHGTVHSNNAEHPEVFNSRHVKAISVPMSTGAISKSISFHKSTEDMDLEMDDKFGGDKHRKSLFKLSGFRFTFKGKNRKSHPSYRGDVEKDNLQDLDGRSGNRQSQSSLAEIRAFQLEAGDEILAKYRKKAPASTATSSLKSSNSEISETMSNVSDNVLMDNTIHNFEQINVENSAVFSDAKCKLRLVLGSADLQTLPWLNHSRGRSISGGMQRLQENELVAFLKVLLAEAINLQQRPLMAHLHEALRCVRLFDDIGCQKLFKSLRDDYRKRAPYIAYLVRCRQGLLSTLSHLDTLTERVERDKQVCSQYLVMTSVRIFLEKHDRYLQHFVRTFQELVVADEKAIKVEEFLNQLFNSVQNDTMWQTANESQIEHAKAVIEHSVMSRIYTFALHPNGDGDVLRDKVLHEHMQKLSQVITPDHKDLRIPKIYHSECPWPSAQAELVNINAYKTPRDKIQCVLRCCNTIMNLLSMASNKSVPAADDLMPVLVYVLIKANPPHLLSTVQYVNTFYEKQLEGEEAYWWTQFASGVEFIKNMDYS